MLLREHIEATLRAVEEEYGVAVLYACESGSRVWGFASGDSDYDVRGIFMYPRSAYLKLDRPTDEIGFIHGEFDLQLWDIYKYFDLERKSNPSALEWANSPLIYRLMPRALREHWSEIFANYWWDRRAILHHYWGLARGEWHRYVKEKSVVTDKKYLYVLRPLVIAEWIRQTGMLPLIQDIPTLIGHINNEKQWVSDDVRREINELIARKRLGEERMTNPPNPILDAFILAEFDRAQETRDEWDVRSVIDKQAYQDSIDRTLSSLLVTSAPFSILAPGTLSG